MAVSEKGGGHDREVSRVMGDGVEQSFERRKIGEWAKAHEYERLAKPCTAIRVSNELPPEA